jgi:hypothetical protein
MWARRVAAGIAVVAAAAGPMLVVHSGVAEAERRPRCCSTAPAPSAPTSPYWRLVVGVR